MPEGDVVRRTAARLDAALAGQVLSSAELRWPTAAGRVLAGRAVLHTRAYGKHLLTRLDDGRTLHTHLRMDGVWVVERTGAPRSAARRADARAVLATRSWTVVGLRLGMLDLVPTREEHALLGHLGPDVLADDYAEAGRAEILRRLAARRDEPIAAVLLDQRVAAGIGTIYAAESLFARRVWPWTPADRIGDPGAVVDAARALMERSIRAQLPTATGDLRSGWTTRVHGREGLPCRRCGTTIAVGRAGTPPQDRPLFYCPQCQTAPPPR